MYRSYTVFHLYAIKVGVKIRIGKYFSFGVNLNLTSFIRDFKLVLTIVKKSLFRVKSKRHEVTFVLIQYFSKM